jgi:hypothetical protein
MALSGEEVNVTQPTSGRWGIPDGEELFAVVYPIAHTAHREHTNRRIVNTPFGHREQGEATAFWGSVLALGSSPGEER